MNPILKKKFASFVLNKTKFNNVIQKLYPIAITNKYGVKKDGILDLNLTRDRIGNISSKFRVADLSLENYIRLGDDCDGGYVVVDNIKKKDVCLCIGIGDNISFDKAVSPFVSRIHMYDHTVDAPRDLPSNAIFNKIGLSKEIRHNMTTLDECINRISDKEEVILKIDIEGSEWDVFSSVSLENLSRCKQIIVELHNIHFFRNDEFFETMLLALDKLNCLHTLVNIHANNWSAFDIIAGIPVPNVLEVTYIRSDILRENMLCASRTNFNHMNKRNNPVQPDIELSFIKFQQ